MDIEILRNEIERLYGLDELTALSRDLLGLDPEQIGGTLTKASFARALTERCAELDALEALVEAVLGTRPDADPRLRDARTTDEGYALSAVVGPFTIARRLGDGSASIVYAALANTMNVVLKVLRTEATRDRGAVQRCFAVARLLGRSDVAGLATGVVAGRLSDTGPFYIAYHDPQGEPLTARVRRDGPMHFQQAKTLVRSLLETLAALHDRGLSHGNLKLNNVLLGRGPQSSAKITLVDAGLDRLGIGARALSTATGAALLGATTIAPEQIRGQIATPRTDVYGVGGILWEMLTGQPLFGGTSAMDAAAANLIEEPKPPSTVGPRGWIPKDLDALVLALLRKDPKARPRDARAILGELDAVGRAHAPQAARTITDDDFNARVSALLATPGDENAAMHVEGAVSEGADPDAVAQALQMSAEEALTDDVKRGLLYRAARVHEGAAHSSEAETIYAQLVALDPSDDIAAGTLVKLRVSLGKFDEAVEALLTRADQTSGAEKARVMSEIGHLYATDLDDRSQAVVAYVQAFCDDPQTAAYADEIERLAGNNATIWNEATNILASVSAEEMPIEKKIPLFGRLGRFYSEKVNRPDLAVACFQAVLAVDPGNDGAMLGLSTVYAKAQQWTELAQMLIRRAGGAGGSSVARNLLTEAAEVYEKKLSDTGRARELYQQVLDQDPGHERASDGLVRLLEQANDYAALVQVLDARATEQRGDKRAALLARIAETYEDSLNDLNEATRRYEAVLADDPSNAAGLKGLDRIYSRTGRYKELVGVLKRQIATAVTPRQRITLWERLAAIYEEEFLDHAQAAEACEDILEIDPSHDQALAALARHYRALDKWEDVAETYARHLKVTVDNARKVELLLAMAKVLFEQIGSPGRAVETYEQVVAIDPSQPVALDALARLRAGSGDANLALQAIETLAHQAATPEAKSEQWMRAAKLLEKGGDFDAAIERYKAALDANPRNAGAADALRSAYASRGDAPAAIELIARRVEIADGALAKARLFGEMARLCKYKVNDDDRAHTAATQANHLDPTNLDALMVLGDLAFESDRFLEAAAHYELPANRTDKLVPEDATRILVRYVDALYKTGGAEKALASMDALLKIAPDNSDALSRVARVTFDHGDPKRANQLYKDLLARFRERMMLSEEADALFRVGESARRAGMLKEAFASLSEAVDLDPSASEAYAALAKLYQSQGDWEKVADVKTRRLDVAQGDERYDLLLEIADIYALRIKDSTRAAKTYVAALEERPEDRNVLTKLMQLYSEEKDWTKLVEVVLKLSDFVDDKKQKAKYLQTAAIVSARQLGEVEVALDYYDRALSLDPSNSKCLTEAIALRSQKGDHEGVEALLKVKLERANESGDKDGMLETFVELAELYHKNLGWIGQAIDAYEAVQTLDPDNRTHSDVLATLYASDPAQYLEKAVAAQRNILRQNPDRADSYKLLRRLYTEVKRADAAWCMCQALYLLNLAEPDEERFFRRMRAEGPAAARSQLNQEEYQLLLLHQDADPMLGGILSLIEPAIIGVRSQTFEALGYDQSYLVDLANHSSQLARTVYYAASVLGVSLPPAFENQNDPGALGFLHAQTPSIVLGQYALTAEIPPQTAAFIAARHISYYRSGMYVRHLVPTGTGLKAWLFAAIKMISPAFPIQADLEGPVRESLAALDKAIQGPTRERLASLVSKLLGGGGSIDLKRWVAAADLTADRAGFLLAHDLQVSGEIIKAIGEEASTVPIKERLKELLLFATSEQYFALRTKLGLSIDT